VLTSAFSRITWGTPIAVTVGRRKEKERSEKIERGIFINKRELKYIVE
jgi:hypothetical protein